MINQSEFQAISCNLTNAREKSRLQGGIGFRFASHFLSGFQRTVEKPKPKQLLRPITTEANSAMNQSQFLAISCYSIEAREKSRVHGAIGFGFDFHWLKNWYESFKPITKCSNPNHVITFDSHLKTALSQSVSVAIATA